MNYLTKIKAMGLKSGDFDQKLQRLNLIVGPSGSGKTKYLDAIRLALSGKTLLGRDEQLKDSKSGILTLSGGDLTVVAQDDAGRVNEREWPSGVESLEIPQPPDILLDSGEYFSLAARPRAAYVVEHYATGEEYSREALAAEVKNIRLEANTEDTEKAINELVEIVMADKETSAPRRIGSLIEKFKARQSEATAEVKRMTATVSAITQLIDAAVPLRNPDGEIQREKAALAELQTSQGEVNGQVKAKRERTEAVIKLTEERRQCVGPDAAACRTAIEEWQERIAKLRGEANGKTAFDEEITEIEGLIVEAQAFLDKLAITTAKQKPLLIQKGDAEWAIADRKAKIEALKRQTMIGQKKMIDGLADIYQVAKHCCPACAQIIDTRMKKSLRDDYEAFHKSAEVDYAKLSAEQLDLEAQLTAVVNDLEKVDKALADEKSVGNMLKLNQKDLAEAQRQRDTSIRNSRNAIEASQIDINRLQERLNSHQATVERAAVIDQQLDGHRQWMISHQDVEAQAANIGKAIEAANSRLRALEDRRQNYIRAQAAEVTNVQAIEAAKVARARLEVVKLAVGKLQDIQRAITDGAFASIVVVVNQITQGIIKETVEYREGELGRFVKNVWVPVEAFSQGQKLLVYAGVSLALAKDAPIKLVMIDNLGDLDFEAMTTLLKTMDLLIQTKVVDQFVGCWSAQCYDADLLEIEELNIVRVK